MAYRNIKKTTLKMHHSKLFPKIDDNGLTNKKKANILKNKHFN